MGLVFSALKVTCCDPHDTIRGVAGPPVPDSDPPDRARPDTAASSHSSFGALVDLTDDRHPLPTSSSWDSGDQPARETPTGRAASERVYNKAR